MVKKKKREKFAASSGEKRTKYFKTHQRWQNLLPKTNTLQ